MKIVHVTAALSRQAAGVSAALWSLARSQRALGHDVRVLGLADEFLAQDIGPDPGCRYRACAWSFPRGLSYSSDMGAALEEEGTAADIVHSHGLWLHPGIVARRFAAGRRIPLVVSPHGMLEPWALAHRRIKKTVAWQLFERKNLKAAACLHATSGQEALNLGSLRLDVPVKVVPLGVDLGGYSVQEENRLPRRLMAGAGGKRLLLFLSRIHPKKGPDRLIEAWARVASGFPEWHLIMTGPSDENYKAQLEAQINMRGVGATVHLAGPAYDADKRELMAGADLFVLPTHSENFGLVVLESLAAGVPVITTKGAPWSILEAHRCGWWIDQGVEPLTRALRDAMSLPRAKLREMGQRGRRLAEEDFSWPVQAKKMIETYEWLRGRAGEPSWVVRG